MDSKDLVQMYGFIEVEEWVEIGPFILRNVQGDAIQNQLPTGAVVFAMRYHGDHDDLSKAGHGLAEGKSDILYIGYSTKLGVEPSERLRNMRDNHQSTNQNIREGMANVYALPGGCVDIGWRSVESEHEAKQLCTELKAAFFEEHGCPPPWNRR